MSIIEVSSSLTPINPSDIFTDGFELSSQSIIPSQDYSGSFTENLNNIEFYVYDANQQIQYSNYDFTEYTITENSNPNASGTNIVNIDPQKDVYDAGFSNGKLTAIYNFVNHELSSSIDNLYYISEISSDRTEIRLKSNFISNSEMLSSFISFEQILTTADYFDEFYISFGSNENHIGINTKIEMPEENTNGTPVQYSILIKLYDGLPLKYNLEDELYIITKTGESQAFQIEFDESINITDIGIPIKGPNTNLEVKDFVNNSTTYKNKNELLSTNSSASKDELLNILNQEGIHLTPNYSTSSFNEFVNFSSAKARVNNFYIKASNIESYENDINIISATTGSNALTVSSSIAGLFTKIENVIKNFDGYEYYLYYNTSSDSYPKNLGTNDVYPYPLLSTGSVQVLTWLGSDDTNNPYYGGTLFSASFYDENNENWLYYTIPSFIVEQNSNDNYIEFCNMAGQSFDELWLYTKTITEKLNTTNQLDKGVPLSLADDVITSLGYAGYGNNYNNQDNFIGLAGNDNGSYVPPTGSELITNYIAVNQGSVENYWLPSTSYEEYVLQLGAKGWPYPIDRVSKEIFKRLYHNMSYLVKKKGTVAGLRQLINIWGIPSTILRINEFGGKNKDETDDYDLWYRRYSYAYTPVAKYGNQVSASAVIPWMPLKRNFIADVDSLGTLNKTPDVLLPANSGANSGGAAGTYTNIRLNRGGYLAGENYALATIVVTGGGVISSVTITDSSLIINPVVGDMLIIDSSDINPTSGTITFILDSSDIILDNVIVPDGVGFRFKTTGFPSSSFNGDFYSQSLAVKKSNGIDDNNFDWGISLFYTGSTSGSYSGSSNSDYYDYGEMKFFMSGGLAGNLLLESPPIYLPFFDKGWWTVLLQRDNHSPASASGSSTTYTLYVKNKLYDGWDGNSIGFEGSASITSTKNTAWSNYGVNELDGVYLGGRTEGSKVQNFITNESGKGFSGSFQEFRYYSNEISESVFNDLVMNPESIEGNQITGSKSSFDIVNFRAPLGNELESTFQNPSTSSITTVYPSMHPAVSASSPQYITGSFINPVNITTTSSYIINYEVDSSPKTYSRTNVETYFLDQPAIGIRNRVTNKIQATSNLNFGTALSNVVSIQKDPFISQSYTENINQLEVAFSPQDEINDDIIATFGYGAIQDAIADPRFRSSSADNYPKLASIADDYFRKYEGSDIFDYLRLIKYFDDSLFKAIKNYVPARTSVSTGIVIKQNMLERNRYREPQVNSYTTQSYATNNIPLTTQNLLLTGSIADLPIEGGAGGSVNEYNILNNEAAISITRGNSLTIPSTKINLFSSPTITNLTSSDISFVDDGIDPYLETKVKWKGNIRVNAGYMSGASSTTIFYFFSSSLRGEFLTSGQVGEMSVVGGVVTPAIVPTNFFTPTPYLDMLPGEKFFIKALSSLGTVQLNNISIDIGTSIDHNPYNLISLSQSYQTYPQYNQTALGLVTESISTQDEFYDGEYSGSTLATVITQSNPYKLVPPSSIAVVSSSQLLTQGAGAVNFQNPFSTGDGFSAPTSAANGGLDISFSSSFVSAVAYAYLFNITDVTLVPFQTYDITYDLEILVNNSTANQTFGLAPFIYDPVTNYPWTSGTNLTASAQYNGFSATSGSTYANGSPQYPQDIGNYQISFSFQVQPPTTFGETLFTGSLWRGNWYDMDTKYALGLNVAGKSVGSFKNFQVRGRDGMYKNQQALIPWNLNCLSGSFDILNTQSLILENSDYNPLNNNVEINRKSTTHYRLEYGNSGIGSPLKVGFDLLPYISTAGVYALGAIVGTFEVPLFPFKSVSSSPTPIGRDAKVMVTGNGTTITSIIVSKPGRNYVPTPSLHYLFDKINYCHQILPADLVTAGFTGATGVLLLDKLPPEAINYNSSNEFSRQTPSNKDEIHEIMTNKFSQSSATAQSFLATLQDSNYTSLAYLNPRYRGSKIKSLNYNKYTSSGSVGPANSLPQQPYNTSPVISQSVAVAFLDGSTGSWGGDEVNDRLTSVIDKYPQYIAHFRGSYAQLNYYNSREFRIDSLISISMDNLSGEEIIPISIDIDGSNENKKWVSSVFEPNRRVAVSYNPTNVFNRTNTGENVNIKPTLVGDYDLLGGSIQYLTLNSNARSRVTTANAYNYTLGNQILPEIVYSGQISGAIEGANLIESGSGNQTFSPTNKGLVYIDSGMTSGKGEGGHIWPLLGITNTSTAFGFGSVNLYSSQSQGGTKFAQNYSAGETITVTQAQLINAGWAAGVGDLKFTLQEGDVLTKFSTPNIFQQTKTIQMITASNTNDDGFHYGFLLSGSDTTGSFETGGTFLLPFCQDGNSSKGMEDFNKLSIGGPQLALFHGYNSAVENQQLRPGQTCPSNFISASAVWVPQGIDPTIKENYFQFAPSSSDCVNYQDDQQPFLLQRGDVLRVEGVRDVSISSTQTQSISFIEDFTVMEMQEYFYTSSAFTPDAGSFIPGVSPATFSVNGAETNYLYAGQSYYYGYSIEITSAGATNQKLETSGTGTGLSMFVGLNQAQAGGTRIFAVNIDVNAVGTGYVAGETVTIPKEWLNTNFGQNASPTYNFLYDIIITITSQMLASYIPQVNDWTVKVDLSPGCGFPNLGYKVYDRGKVAISMKTFAKTDRNPTTVLAGLASGEITKVTFRRQIENESSVMVKNTQAPKGSKGFLTQTGGGFLIPKDLSEIQKGNALNIINQLRQKNAYPGDSALDIQTEYS